jgi:hypothetical protein
MLLSTRQKVLSRAILGLVAIASCVCMTSLACTVVKWKELMADPIQPELRLFDRYQLDVKGIGTEYRCHLEIRLSFLLEQTDTTELADIPMVSIDSACLLNVNPEGRLCARAVGWANLEKERYFLVKDDTRDLVQIRPDLWFTKKGRLIPAGFVLEWTTKLPVLRWPKDGMEIQLYARLVDRQSNTDRGSITDTVAVRVGSKARWEPMS